MKRRNIKGVYIAGLITILFTQFIPGQTTTSKRHYFDYYGDYGIVVKWYPSGWWDEIPSSTLKCGTNWISWENDEGELYRGYLAFNLSNIPDDAIIWNASLHLKCIDGFGIDEKNTGIIRFRYDDLAFDLRFWWYDSEWEALAGNATLGNYTFTKGETTIISGQQLIDLIYLFRDSHWDQVLEFGLINTDENNLENGLLLSTEWNDLYLKVTYTRPVCELMYHDLSSPHFDIESDTIMFQANSGISASNRVTSSSDVTYKAGNYVILKPGFYVDQSSYFHASIESCEWPPPATKNSISHRKRRRNNNEFKPDKMKIDQSKDQIRIYPNPSKGLVYIHQGEDSGSKYVSVYSLSGNIVFGSETNNDFVEIDLSHCSKGIYIVKVINSDGHHCQKIILE